MIKILKVHELIEKLEKMPKDSIVLLEGCDCYQEAFDVKLELDHEKKHYVLITNNMKAEEEDDLVD